MARLVFRELLGTFTASSNSVNVAFFRGISATIMPTLAELERGPEEVRFERSSFRVLSPTELSAKLSVEASSSSFSRFIALRELPWRIVERLDSCKEQKWRNDNETSEKDPWEESEGCGYWKCGKHHPILQLGI